MLLPVLSSALQLNPSVMGLAVREQRQGDLEPQADVQAAHVAHFAAALDKMITRSRSAGTSPETGVRRFSRRQSIRLSVSMPQDTTRSR